MNDRVLIGKANFNRSSGGGKGKWFYIKDNTDNIYRVLPPIKSLASTGKIAKWYAVHRNLRDKDGRQRAFLCLEDKNKDGLVTKHCPLCDRVKELENQLKIAKDQGANPEQLKNFRTQHIFPLQVEKKYYINVVNQEGAIGIISLGSKMYKALEQLCKQWEAKGYDISGMQGVYVNFKKMTRYKGDKEAVHTVEVYMQPAADGSFRFVTHDLTAEFCEKIGQEAADLVDLFKSLTADQIATLTALDGEDRASALSSFFNAAETDTADEVENLGNGALAAPIPGSNASVVARMETTPTGMVTHVPTIPSNFQPTPNNNQGQFAGTQKVDQTNLFQQQQTQKAVANGVPKTGLSDEEFLAICKPK